MMRRWGHPLFGKGLAYYSVHEVRNSSLIEMLERRNSVHPRHDRSRYLRDLRHYVFTFQDSMLECVVTEGEWGRPRVSVVATEEEAEQAWRREGE